MNQCFVSFNFHHATHKHKFLLFFQLPSHYHTFHCRFFFSFFFKCRICVPFACRTEILLLLFRYGNENTPKIKGKNKKNIIAQCDRKIENMSSTDYCRHHSRMTHTFWFASYCIRLVFALLIECVCAIAEKIRTNSLVYYFNCRNSVLLITVSSVLFGIFHFHFHSLHHILEVRTIWHITFSRLLFRSDGCRRSTPNAQINLLQHCLCYQVPRCWWNGKQTPHKTVNKYSIKSFDRFVQLHRIAYGASWPLNAIQECCVPNEVVTGKQCNWHGLSPSVFNIIEI